MPAPPDSKIKMLALHIAIGGTVKAWCAAEKISVKTVYNWTRRPSFRRLVDRHRARLVDMTLGRLAKASTGATAALERIIRPTSKAKDADVIAAAKAIHAAHMEYAERVDVAQRLAALENPPSKQRKQRP